MKIIIYGSQYGTARKYAEELAKRTNIEIKNYKDVTDIDQYNTVVYIGSLYAGGMKRQLSKKLYENAYIFHLRGGIDYSCLNFKHKTMMGLLYKKAVGLPEEKKTAEIKAMIETYNQKVNFVDFESLNRLTDCI